MQHFDLATSARTLKTPHRSTTSPRPPRFNEGQGCQLRRRPHRASRPPSSADILRREAATRLLRGTPRPPPGRLRAPASTSSSPLDFSTCGPVANLGPKGASSTWPRRVSRRGGLVRRDDNKTEDVEETRLGIGLRNLIQRHQLPSALDKPHLELPRPLHCRRLCDEGVEHRHEPAGDPVRPSAQQLPRPLEISTSRPPALTFASPTAVSAPAL